VRRHDLDLLSLIVGAVFLVVATTHLLVAASDRDTNLGWLFPVVLVGLGAAGIAGALRPVRREAVAAGTVGSTTDSATDSTVDSQSESHTGEAPTER